VSERAKQNKQKYLAHDLRVNYTGRHFINIFALGLMDCNEGREGGFACGMATVFEMSEFCIKCARFSRELLDCWEKITNTNATADET
jgi:hypothetical protein